MPGMTFAREASLGARHSSSTCGHCFSTRLLIRTFSGASATQLGQVLRNSFPTSPTRPIETNAFIKPFSAITTSFERSQSTPVFTSQQSASSRSEKLQRSRFENKGLTPSPLCQHANQNPRKHRQLLPCRKQALQMKIVKRERQSPLR